TITTAGGPLVVNGNIATTGANNIMLTGTGVTQGSGSTVDAGAGTITIDANDGAINMAGSLTTTNATASAVRIVDAADVVLGNVTAAAGRLVLGEAGTQNLSGPVTQNMGTSLNVSALTGTTGSSAALGNNNAIADLETFTTNGAFTLNDAGGLNVTGNVSTSNNGLASITTSGTLAVNGNI